MKITLKEGHYCQDCPFLKCNGYYLVCVACGKKINLQKETETTCKNKQIKVSSK